MKSHRFRYVLKELFDGAALREDILANASRTPKFPVVVCLNLDEHQFF